MMMKSRSLNKLVIIMILALLASGITPTKLAETKSKIYLSKTKKTYDWPGLWDKITLKGIPANAKITWKSSNTKVVKIKDKIKCGTWFKLVGSGKAKITAKYRGKKYTCRIKVKKDTSSPTPKPTKKPKPDTDEQDDSIYNGAYLNETDVTIYRCPDWAIPYAHDPNHPLEIQFKVLGTDKKPYWKLEYEEGAGLSITQDGLLKFADVFLGKSNEATVVAKLSNTKKLTAHVTIVSETKLAYDEKIDDFNARYIHDGMTEYEIADAVNKYVSHEFDYAKEAAWECMVITGAGDCMASRLGVERLCRELGLKAYALCDTTDHGECLIRIGDDVYLSITGYGGTKPRPYSFYKLSEESLQKKVKDYPRCLKALGFE